MTVINRPRGTQDLFPPRSLIYQKIQQIATEVLRKNNYQPIFFPTFEVKELFTGSLGSSTDIIHKQMYTFSDKKGRELALRPEGTAGVVRLVCQNDLGKENQPLKLYYWANMFRYERPQKGRYREFWQLGVELVNAGGVLADYQILKLVNDLLLEWGVKNFSFNLNYLGSQETREKYKKELERYVEDSGQKSLLCEDCQRRYQTNPLRILDCSLCKKNLSFPSYQKVWNEKDNEYINELNQFLNRFDIPYNYDYFLVRGLDYYTGLVFEINLGDEKAVLGGGRYDQFFRRWGENDLPAVGFAVGIDRLVDYCQQNQLLTTKQQVDIYFLVLNPTDYPEVLTWKKELETDYLVEYNLDLKKKLSLAPIISYYQPQLLILLKEKAVVKDCRSSSTKNFSIAKEKVVEWITNYLKK